MADIILSKNALCRRFSTAVFLKPVSELNPVKLKSASFNHAVFAPLFQKVGVRVTGPWWREQHLSHMTDLIFSQMFVPAF